jgi:hypothetical protein
MSGFLRLYTPPASDPTRKLMDPPLFKITPLCGKIGRIAWWNSDPAGEVSFFGTRYWGKVFWYANPED